MYLCGVRVYALLYLGDYCVLLIFILLFNVQSYIFALMQVTLKEYALNHNPRKNRRGHKMSEGYLYRLIRQDIKGSNTCQLWFDYVLTGNKDRILINLN